MREEISLGFDFSSLEVLDFLEQMRLSNGGEERKQFWHECVQGSAFVYNMTLKSQGYDYNPNLAVAEHDGVQKTNNGPNRNVIWDPAKKLSNFGTTKSGSFFSETAQAMNWIAKHIYGANDISYAHDIWIDPAGQKLNGLTFHLTANIPTMVPAAVVTYLAGVEANLSFAKYQYGLYGAEKE